MILVLRDVCEKTEEVYLEVLLFGGMYHLLCQLKINN
jgi:hypothetical protein